MMKAGFMSLRKTLFTRKCLFRFGLLLSIAYFAFGIYFYNCDQGKWFTEPNADPTGYVTREFKSIREHFTVDAVDLAAPQVIQYRKYGSLSEPLNGTVFYLHGNKGNMEKCEWEIECFLQKGYDVWTMDYRGFGESTGILSEKALREDAKKVYDRMKSTGINEREIVVWGRSFGSGVAASIAAAETKPGLLVLETPYWSLPDAARSANLLLPDFLFHYQLPIHHYLSKAKCPIELIHGTQDEKIPFSSSERLYLLCRDELKIAVGRHAIMCAPHNLRAEPEFEAIVNRILR